MTFIYYVDGKKFTKNKWRDVPKYEISSPDENTPAVQLLNSEYKLWCKRGWFWHRLTGPAVITDQGNEQFWLHDKPYENIHDWLMEHPNQDNTFQVEMILKWS